MNIFILISATEAGYIPKVPVPVIKTIDFDGFAGVDVKLVDGSDEKLLMLRGSVDPGVATFPLSWKTMIINGPKATLPEVGMM